MKTENEQRIVFFDMDNTLTRETSSIFLGRAIGKEEESKILDAQIESRAISDEEWYVGTGNLVRGYSYSQLREIYKNIPIIDGIPETIRLLKEKGFKTAIVTVGIGEFARFLSEEYGFDYYFGCTAIVENGIVRGFGPPFATQKDKAKYVNQLCAQLMINPRKCIAIGDSYTDLHMFDAVGTSIAINHSSALEGRATHYIKSCANLAEIIKFVQ